MHMTLYSARVGKRRRVNRGAWFCRRKTVEPFMGEYAIGLKAPKGLNLRIDTTGYARAIMASSARKRSDGAKRYD